MESDHFVCQVPLIDIGDTALDCWMQDRLADVEVSLTKTITSSGNWTYHALANRALVRARVRHWEAAIDDAERVSFYLLSHTLILVLIYFKSIGIRPSVIGYIAKSVALIGGGKKEEGCRVYDLAFRHCHPLDVDLLLLIKVRVHAWLNFVVPQFLILPRL